MITVHKYAVPATPAFEVMLPIGAEFCHVAQQHDSVCMWFEVNTNAPLKLRRFITLGTGHELIYADAKFLGTWLHDNGDYVFHLYEIPA
jgi:hypothetical protein